MGVILAKTAGFCYGVERAVELAKRTAAEGGCVMLGSIIHNAAVVQELETLGARTVEDVSQIQPGETVIIRSHGEPVETYRALEEKGARIVDATCPNVARIHQLVAKAEAEGRTPLIIGEPFEPVYTGRKGTAEEYTANSHEVMRRAYALGGVSWE